jgi:hypothetical protein
MFSFSSYIREIKSADNGEIFLSKIGDAFPINQC